MITLGVFVIFSALAFNGQEFRWNHALAGVLLLLAVRLFFKKCPRRTALSRSCIPPSGDENDGPSNLFGASPYQ
ncbi:MAG: hypothetical protein ACOH13_12095 [Flavobacteriales bacterium]